MKILDGKLLAKHIKDDIKNEILELNIQPILNIITVGNDPASKSYVNSKLKACEYCGIKTNHMVFPENISEEKLISEIKNVTKPTIIQLPLPKHINTQKCVDSLNPELDVDGFNTINLGKLFAGTPDVIPATPLGILKILHYYNIPIEGKNVVVIGRSNIVGKPIAQLLLQQNANVTMLHSHTKKDDLDRYCCFADIIIVAVGKPKFLQKCKIGATVIDVGINRIPSDNEKGYEIVGDVDPSLYKYLSYYTPVPGGVGPMTVISLLVNIVNYYKCKCV